jgi:hypothetical protein
MTMAYDASSVERPSRRPSRRGIVLLCALLGAGPSMLGAQGFSFSKDEEKERAAEAEQARKVAELVSVPCQARIKDRKILLLLAERTEQRVESSAERYVGRRGA